MANEQLFSDNAQTTLTSDILSGNSTITGLDAAEVARFAPTTIVSGDYEIAGLSDGTNTEIIRIRQRNTTDLQILRAQEGSAAFAFSAGSIIYGSATALLFTTLNTKTQDNETLSLANSVQLNINTPLITTNQTNIGTNATNISTNQATGATNLAEIDNIKDNLLDTIVTDGINVLVDGFGNVVQSALPIV